MDPKFNTKWLKKVLFQGFPDVFMEFIISEFDKFNKNLPYRSEPWEINFLLIIRNDTVHSSNFAGTCVGLSNNIVRILICRLRRKYRS